ncbi:hypothetical protein [Thermohalobacter berrensis]|uniref:Uncharacterized protein n=1 Tax=Thermohalobacter berrensis TaxID=99594 RepID=A0A419T4J0_9FIRM|nr:hypothetical protein [Thermohalobacter berrensis]RKD32298.1 hypothetical protein BET03_03025 [Thermohalobacter berrensis]
MEYLRELVERDLKARYGKEINVTEKQIKEAVDVIGRDVVYNYLILGQDVSFKTFFRNLEIYIRIISD